VQSEIDRFQVKVPTRLDARSGFGPALSPVQLDFSLVPSPVPPFLPSRPPNSALRWRGMQLDPVKLLLPRGGVLPQVARQPAGD